MTDGLDEYPDVKREQVEDAGKDLTNAAIRLLTSGLRTTDKQVGYCIVHTAQLVLRMLHVLRVPHSCLLRPQIFYCSSKRLVPPPKEPARK